MKRPILAYGHSILKQKCQGIENSYPELNNLIADMWETMHYAHGCGLAAPQIGLSINLFVIDSQSTYANLAEEDRKLFFTSEDTGIRETFINTKIIERSPDMWEDEEGCLSIPGVFKKIKRPWSIQVEYHDAQFEKRIRSFSGATARMIQHEYDHTQGILFLDHLQPLAKKQMESKLQKILKGRINPNYPMRFI